MDKSIKLGDTVSCRVTGFKGVVTGLVDYITGCSQALIVPPVGPDGVYREPHWFDVQRLTVDASVARVEIDNGSNPGFDLPAPIR